MQLWLALSLCTFDRAAFWGQSGIYGRGKRMMSFRVSISCRNSWVLTQPVPSSCAQFSLLRPPFFVIRVGFIVTLGVTATDKMPMLSGRTTGEIKGSIRFPRRPQIILRAVPLEKDMWSEDKVYKVSR
ncbi:hypothetical protein N7510_010167 [Penicillium lagena]|uniref:uncharacterized protein n=1 Tax=Penicillium lagena TaxID=94218 RepID=UPI0025407ABB|nr:uncharacterized protein N7510_010167 [Penicillium lagena]KAJ5605013.1 hypothetical protein N7510_010167 [Penicillium lagena]